MVQPLPVPTQSAATTDRQPGIRPTPWWLDVLLVLMVGAIGYGVARAAAQWSAPLSPNVQIDLSVRRLPLYAALSTLRMSIAHHLAADTHAVSIRFSDAGDYIGFDSSSPLWRTGGKPQCVATLGLPLPIAAMGDGMTDAELVGTVATFIAFTSFARHERVVSVADAVISTFADLPALILG